MSTSTTTTLEMRTLDHPPDTRQLESLLPRLGLLDRIAVRMAVRAIVRLQRELERRTATPHEIALSVEHGKAAADRFPRYSRTMN